MIRWVSEGRPHDSGRSRRHVGGHCHSNRQNQQVLMRENSGREDVRSKMGLSVFPVRILKHRWTTEGTHTEYVATLCVRLERTEVPA